MIVFDVTETDSFLSITDKLLEKTNEVGLC